MNLQEMFKEGKLALHAELLKKYRPSMLELLKIQGLGPKTIALDLERLSGKRRGGRGQTRARRKDSRTPSHGRKTGTENSSRPSRTIGASLDGSCSTLPNARRTKSLNTCATIPGVEKITPAGSLRRGRETVGDLDILVTGKACCDDGERQKLIEHIIKLPGLMEIIASGENKVSFRLRAGMQVDVRLLPPDSFGAAMQYFTGSKAHNVALRQRALKMGYTLSEYSLAKLDTEEPVAGKTEEEIYGKLNLDYIPPELRENLGELDAAEAHTLPALISQADLQGDVHMHTVETDGRNTIEEMAEAAAEHGYRYMAITDHSKNLAFANGLDDKRAIEHIKRIRAVNEKTDKIRIFAGIEVDILADGTLDLSDSVLEQMDIVIASVHSHFNQSPAEMTDRLLKTVQNPNVSLLGHPTGRLLLRRDAYAFDIDAVLKEAAQKKVAMELNAYPDRLDLSDRHLRLAKQHGVKIVINTDSHHTSHMEKIRFGVLQARRAWLTKADVLNTLSEETFAKAMKHVW